MPLKYLVICAIISVDTGTGTETIPGTGNGIIFL